MIIITIINKLLIYFINFLVNLFNLSHNHALPEKIFHNLVELITLNKHEVFK